MSENKKSILAETLENIEAVKQQIEENANFALTSTLKDELSAIIKEGIADDISSDDETAQDVTGTDAPVDSTPIDDAPAADDVASLDEPSLGGEESGEEVIDLTGATPEEVIGSFKLMAPTDEIEIVKTASGIELKLGEEGGEESIAAATDLGLGVDAPGEETPAVEPTEEPAPEAPADEEGSEDDEEKLSENESLFEIEIVDEETATEEEPVEEAMSHHLNMKKRNIAHNGNDPLRVDETEAVAEEAVVAEEAPVAEEVNESKEKLVATRKKLAALTLENAKLKAQMNTINENVAQYQASEEEYKQAIGKLKNQLQEVAVFTSNLTYAVKLMTENTTTKEEKINIIKSFDKVKTVTESREKYQTLTESFQNSKTTSAAAQIIESKILADEKISSASKINETKVYENPGVARIKEIIGKISN